MKTINTNKTVNTKNTNIKIIMVDAMIIEVERKKIKNMYLRVKPPEGTVRISAPMKISEDYITMFIRSRMDWIKQQQVKIKEIKVIEEVQYENGEKLWFMGHEYILEVLYDLDSGKGKISVVDNKIIMHVPANATLLDKEVIMQKWNRELLYQFLEPVVLKWEEVIGVKSTSWYIRRMKTCWGTCNVAKKRLCFNLQLVTKAPELIEYVVVHELIHLLERSHNQRFKNFMSLYMPDWRKRKVVLNNHEKTEKL